MTRTVCETTSQIRSKEIMSFFSIVVNVFYRTVWYTFTLFLKQKCHM